MRRLPQWKRSGLTNSHSAPYNSDINQITNVGYPIFYQSLFIAQLEGSSRIVTDLIILSLLRQRPMHGYEIQQTIQTSRVDVWTNVLSGSIYYALNKMEKEGLIRTEAEERTGARLRKIYAITEQGERYFKEKVRESLTLAPHSVKSDFVLGLTWIDELPREEAKPLLEQNVKELEATLEQWKLGKEIKRQYGLPPIAEASFDNAIALLELDIAYLRKVIGLMQQ